MAWPTTPGSGALTIDGTLTIAKTAASNSFFVLNDSDVTHGFLTGGTETYATSDFFDASKMDDNLGGAELSAIAEDGATAIVLGLRAWGGTATTGKDTTAEGLIDLYAAEHDGADTVTNITDNGNVLVVRRRISGSNQAAFIVDEDGDLYADGTTGSGATVGLFDTENDIALVRAFDLNRAEKDDNEDQLIRTEWDDWAAEHKERLVELKVVGADGPNGERGLVNITQLQRLHNGCLVQAHQRHLGLMALVEKLTDRLALAESKLATFPGMENGKSNI